MKDIKGFEGRYQVNEFGQVYSLLKKKWLKPGITKGYLMYTLTPVQIKPQKTFTAHALVYSHFVNENYSGTINHKDGNKQNNHFSNLEAITHSENVRHAINSGLKKYDYTYFIEKDGQKYKSLLNDIADMLGVTRINIFLMIQKHGVYRKNGFEVTRVRN